MGILKLLLKSHFFANSCLYNISIRIIISLINNIFPIFFIDPQIFTSKLYFGIFSIKVFYF
ncbi:hypothetical protein CJE0209 [Campylobacter jejuni RM1221]|nr:hypothetical protein CJE0209 [Campylobacter jejuni RM1221]